MSHWLIDDYPAWGIDPRKSSGSFFLARAHALHYRLYPDLSIRLAG